MHIVPIMFKFNFFIVRYKFSRLEIILAPNVFSRGSRKQGLSLDKGLPLKSPYEAIILASLIENETALDEEKSLISGVFIRRLNDCLIISFFVLGIQIITLLLHLLNS